LKNENTGSIVKILFDFRTPLNRLKNHFPAFILQPEAEKTECDRKGNESTGVGERCNDDA